MSGQPSTRGGSESGHSGRRTGAVTGAVVGADSGAGPTGFRSGLGGRSESGSGVGAPGRTASM